MILSELQNTMSQFNLLWSGVSNFSGGDSLRYGPLVAIALSLVAVVCSGLLLRRPRNARSGENVFA